MKSIKRGFAPNLFISILSAVALAGCSVASDCPVPKSSLTARAFDLCFLRNETDDIASPSVQACFTEISKLSDTCEISIKIKEERCLRLAQLDPRVKAMPHEKCLRSKATEGYFVNGCEYPFESECIDRVNAMER